MHTFRIHNILLFCSFLSFFACSKDKVKERGQTVKFMVSREAIAAAPGGIAIYGKTTEGVPRFMALAVDENAPSFEVEIPSGTWQFAGISYTLGSPLEASVGNPSNCFVQSSPVTIEGQEIDIPITLTSSCTATLISQFDGFGTASASSGNFTPIHIMSCKSFSGVDPVGLPGQECNIPASNQGGVSSYRFELLSFDPVENTPLPGILSDCISNTTTATETTTLSQNRIHIPLGTGSLGLPIPTRIITYRDSTCGFESNEFFFPDGIAAGPPIEKDYILAPSGFYATDTRPTIVLPSGEFGVGFSPLDSVLPLWDCDNTSNYVYCGPTIANTFGNFKYAVRYNPTAPGEPLFLDKTIGSCALSSDSNLVTSGCQCTGFPCSAFVQGVTTCTGPSPCAYSTDGLSGQGSNFFDGIATASVMMVDAKGSALLNARATLFNIFGTADGSQWRLLNRFAPHNTNGPSSNENYGFIGELRDFLGPEEAGGLMFKQGLTSCESLGTVPGSNSFDFTIVDKNPGNGDGVSQGHVEISGGNFLIPTFIFGPSGSPTNTTHKFNKKIRISLTSASEDEEILVELNCPGSLGGDIVGLFAVKSTRQNTFNGTETEIETIRRAVLWNLSDSTDKRVEAYDIVEVRDATDNSIKRKQWLLTRAISPSFTTEFVQGWTTNIHYDNFNGGQFDQSRSTFYFKQSSDNIKVAGNSFNGSSYTDNSTVGDLVDGNAICVTFSTLASGAGGCTAISDLTASDKPEIDSSGDFSMNWVGKPNANFQSPMELAFDSFFGL